MEWLREHQWEAWLGASMLLAVAEMFSLDLILLMLAAGGLAGMVTAALGANLAAQVLVASAVSVAMLGVVRPGLVRRLHAGPELRLGHGKLVGQQGVVTEAVSALDHGRIRLAGEIWSAAPYDDSLTIAPGETVEVLQIRGATAYVHPVARLDS